MRPDACTTVRTGLERCRGQGPRADVLSELGKTSECESRGSSAGKKNPEFLPHQLCAGFIVDAPHKPLTDTSRQPCEAGMDISSLKDRNTEAHRGAVPQPDFKPRLDCKTHDLST